MAKRKQKKEIDRKPLWIVILLFLLMGLFMAGRMARSWHFPRVHSAAMPALTPAPGRSSSVTNGKLVMSVIDVGQGDSILLQFPDGQSMLVDAGEVDQGQTVVHYLHSRQVAHLDLLVATHPHSDHIGGMPDVLAAFPVGQVWDDGYNLGSRTQADFLRVIKQQGIPYRNPRRGLTQAFGDVRVEVLAPVNIISGTDSDANNNSIVLRVSDGAVSFLLTGDMEGAERATVPSWPASTVLKVAHHGSRTGTDAAFLRQVQPRVAVISCGLHNSYGHPHAETLAALRAAKVDTRITARDGTVVIATDGRQLSVGGATDSPAPVSPSAATTVAPSAAAPAISAAPSTVTAREARYIGNRRSMVFHRLTCPSLPAERNRVYFKTRDEAIAQGYHPCGVCHP
jgi:competence protein ComEC